MIKVYYGINPAMIRLDMDAREPLNIYNKSEVEMLIMQLNNAYQKAWPYERQS